MRKFVLLLIVTLALSSGCEKEKPQFTDVEIELMPQPQRENLPEATGGFVFAVGNDTITSTEIVEPFAEYYADLAKKTSLDNFKKQAKPQVANFVMNKISNLLIYQQAKLNASDQIDEQLDEAVESEVRRFIAQFGGDYAKAEEAIKNDGFTGWQDFREYQKKLILSQSYLANQLPEEKPVTFSEMMNYYNAVKDKVFVRPPKISFQLIDIQPAELSPADPNTTRQQDAGEDFANLAREFSHGPYAPLGGLWKPLNPDSITPPYDILVKYIQNAEPGQVIGPINTDEHIFIMKLLEKEKQQAAAFEDVQKEIKSQILAERRKQAIDEIILKLIQQADVTNMDEFLDFCLWKIYEKNRA
jgi:parvulin-like peptidyl-prolyl isomerase